MATVIADYTAEHEKCVLLREKLEAKKKAHPFLEIVDANDSFIVQFVQDEQTYEQAFLFSAAINPETTELHLDRWVERKVGRLLKKHKGKGGKHESKSTA